MQKSEFLLRTGKHQSCTNSPAETKPRELVLILTQDFTLRKHVPWALAEDAPLPHPEQGNLVIRYPALGARGRLLKPGQAG